MFDPPSSTQDVVYTRGDLVPFIVISKPTDYSKTTIVSFCGTKCTNVWPTTSHEYLYIKAAVNHVFNVNVGLLPSWPGLLHLDGTNQVT